MYSFKRLPRAHGTKSFGLRVSEASRTEGRQIFQTFLFDMYFLSHASLNDIPCKKVDGT
jgi:hypothetical protein